MTRSRALDSNTVGNSWIEMFKEKCVKINQWPSNASGSATTVLVAIATDKIWYGSSRTSSFISECIYFWPRPMHVPSSNKYFLHANWLKHLIIKNPWSECIIVWPRPIYVPSSRDSLCSSYISLNAQVPNYSTYLLIFPQGSQILQN